MTVGGHSTGGLCGAGIQVCLLQIGAEIPESSHAKHLYGSTSSLRLPNPTPFKELQTPTQSSVDTRVCISNTLSLFILVSKVRGVRALL